MDFLPTFYSEKDKIWSGKPRNSIYDINCSVGKVIWATMKNWPKNVCQISESDGKSTTNQEGITWAIRIAQHLKKRGLGNKDVIGIAAKNTTYVMPLGVACMMNVTPFHAINPMLDESTLKHIFEITKPTLIFCDGSVYEKVITATKSWKPDIYTLYEHIQDIPKIEDLLEPTKTEMFYVPEPISNADQTLAILCSSGTTGMPKAVCISNNVLIQDNMLVSSESVIYTASSLDWITGLMAFIFSTVFGCTRIITNKPFQPENFVELVDKYKINYAVVPPRHLCALVNSPAATSEKLASLRMLNYGGGLVSPSTLQRAQEICKNAMLNSGYGLTEAGTISINVGITKSTSAGKLLPGVRVRIVDDEGKNLGYNEVGEIYVKQPYAWNGYYGNPVETRHMQDSDGWFHTGDLGYFDEKDFLFVVDRKREILKYQGLHYWPTEIEHVIAELPQVDDVCVIGIYNERFGDCAGALIVKQKGSELTTNEVEEHVKKRIEGHNKHLHAGVQFIDKMPHNANGKTVRKMAKEVFASQQNNRKVDN